MPDGMSFETTGLRVAIVGAGYVGLVTAACLADQGHDVVCVDEDEGRIAMLRVGQIPFYEPGLIDLIEKVVAKGRLRFTVALPDAVRQSHIVMLAVGTPVRPEDGHADLQYIHAASRAVAQALSGFAVIVVKSTVPVGTSREVREIVAAANPTLDFEVASNPEFLREGSAIADFTVPDRIVVGVDADRGARVLRALYACSIAEGVTYFETDPSSAEMIKYAANTFLATKVSFINEMADICEKVGGDIEAIAHGMGADRRIGAAFLRPGPGYGGSCFPKDTLAMLRIGERAACPATIIETVIAVNEARPSRMIAKIVAAAGGSVAGRVVAFLGLTFKADTDDVRDSMSLALVRRLRELGAIVRAFDPHGMRNAERVLGDRALYCADMDEALLAADLCVIATEWREFSARPASDYARLLKTPLVVDLRNLFSVEAMEAAGIVYHSIGRRSSRPDAAISAGGLLASIGVGDPVLRQGHVEPGQPLERGVRRLLCSLDGG